MCISVRIFIYNTNDSDENFSGLINEFSDNMKVGGVVDCEEDCPRLLHNMDQLEHWMGWWQIEFNPGESVLMHFGKSNSGGTYRINTMYADVQRNLGVQVHNSLKWTQW